MKLDYSRIAYNIESIPEGEKCIEHFPDLMTQAHIFEADDLPEDVDSDKVLRYLIYAFAPGTPLRNAIPHLDKRRKFILGKLNLLAEAQGGYGEMCLINKPWIIERFIAFTRLQQSEDYAILSSAEVMIDKIQRKLLDVDIDKAGDSVKYNNDLEAWRKTFSEARERIMNEEKSVELARGITFSVKAESLGLSPEETAKVWRATGKIFEDVIP